MHETPLFSVLIPARNQRERLVRTLDSIARTRIDPTRLEVIVVDDGSTDGTDEACRGRRDAFDLQFHRVDYASQSATTNEALRRASGEIVLSSAQDIVFHPELFERHLEWHRRFDGEDVVVLGYLPYPQDLEVTPFMFYLINGGYQFAYYLIRDPLNVPPNFLYAPNFSARRELLNDVGGFDERFPFGCQDTDLGIRLKQRGARIVYDPEAIGFHHHPMTLEEYLGRQQRVGAAVLHLREKHPDYESATGLQELVVHQYLMCSDVLLDRACDEVQRLEAQLLGREADYRYLWTRAFCNFLPLDDFSDAEQMTIRTVERLFKAYNTILGFHWARGFFVEALEHEGAERVESWLKARLAKLQASIPVWKTIERRLGSHQLESEPCSARDYRFSLVVHDVDDYRHALRFLESFDSPPAGRCNVQVIFVIDTAAFTEDQLERLSVLVDLVPETGTGEGVLHALARCGSELVAVVSAKVESIYPEAQSVAVKLLTGVPQIGVIGGAVAESSGRRYGYRRDGARLIASDLSDARTAPIDVVVPECCWFRKSVVSELLSGATAAGSSPWNFQICALAAGASRPVIHVPQLAVRARKPAGSSARDAAGR